jgi:hypothetical protein
MATFFNNSTLYGIQAEILPSAEIRKLSNGMWEGVLQHISHFKAQCHIFSIALTRCIVC